MGLVRVCDGCGVAEGPEIILVNLKIRFETIDKSVGYYRKKVAPGIVIGDFCPACKKLVDEMNLVALLTHAKWAILEGMKELREAKG